MKKSIVIILLVMGFNLNAQTAIPVVDGTTHTSLASVNKKLGDLKRNLKAIKKENKKLTARLKSRAILNKTINILEFLVLVEDAICVVKDIDTNIKLAIDYNLLSNRNCFGDINIKMILINIKNAVAIIKQASMSKHYTLNERSDMILKSFDQVNESFRKLDEIQKHYKKLIEPREQSNKLINTLYGI